MYVCIYVCMYVFMYWRWYNSFLWSGPIYYTHYKHLLCVEYKYNKCTIINIYVQYICIYIHYNYIKMRNSKSMAVTTGVQ